MPEKVTLATPETKPPVTEYEVEYLHFDLKQKLIIVKLIAPTGETKEKRYDPTTNPTGAQLLNTVNTSDNRTVSLIKKVYQRLALDGVLVGTIVGTPD